MHREHPALGERLAQAPADRLPTDVIDRAAEPQHIEVLERIARRGIVSVHSLGRPPLVQDSQRIGHAASVERTLLAAVGAHKTVHQIALLVIRPAAEVGQGLPVIEVVETVSVFADEIAARLEFDAVLPGLGLGKMPHVVEALHELVKLFEKGKTAGQIEKCLLSIAPGNHEASLRQPGDLIPIGATKKVQRRKGKLRDAVGEQIESRIEVVSRIDFKGCEFGICGNEHDFHDTPAARPRQESRGRTCAGWPSGAIVDNHEQNNRFFVKTLC